MIPKKPTFKLVYEGKDITEDVTKYATSVTYTDAVSGESDEIQINLEDTSGDWRNNWRPNKGDNILLEIGYKNSALVNCGSFEVDEIELSGPPDVVNFRALATPVTSPLRSQNSKAFENQSLASIVSFIASKYGLKIVGDIPELTIPRSTQANESDLAFLNRIAKEFFMLFSIRGDTLTFTSIIDIEDSDSVLSIDRADIINYSLTDKTVDIPNEVRTGGTNPRTGENIVGEFKFKGESYLGGYTKTNAEGDPELGGAVNSDKRAAWAKFETDIKRGPLIFGKAGVSTLPEELQYLYNFVSELIDDGYNRIKNGKPIGRLAKQIVANLTTNTTRQYKAGIKYISPNYPQIAKDALNSYEGVLETNRDKERAYQDAYNEQWTNYTQQIADYRAGALEYIKRTKQITGRITIIGQPIALAGNNFKLTGFDRYNGIYHIEKSTHQFTRGGGYVTDLEIKLIRQ
jgi:phage protein D